MAVLLVLKGREQLWNVVSGVRPEQMKAVLAHLRVALRHHLYARSVAGKLARGHATSCSGANQQRPATALYGITRRMESPGPLSRSWTAAGLRGARTAHAGWLLWMAVLWAHDVSGALVQLQTHRSELGSSSWLLLYVNVSWGVIAAAEAGVAAALVPLARALHDRRTRLLVWIACGSAAGGALLTAVALAMSLSPPLRVLLHVLRAAAPASFVMASARILWSSDARVSGLLLGAALFALVVRAGGALTVEQTYTNLLPWSLRALETMATALPIVSAYLVVRHVRRASGAVDPRRDGDPYRVAAPGDDDAADGERRREGCAAADRLGVYTGAACVYGVTAAVGIALFAYQESWSKFYAHAEVVTFTSCLHAAALLVMAVAIPGHGAGGPGSRAAFPGRWLTVLALVLEGVAYLMMASVSQTRGSTVGSGDEFTRWLAERNASFGTASTLAFFGSALTLVVTVQLSLSFKRIAAARGQPVLARRAWRMAVVAGVLATWLVGAALLAETNSYEVASAVIAMKRSAFVQATLALLVLAITAGHALTTRAVAGLLDQP